MKIERFLGSPPLMALGFFVARSIPRRLGYWLACTIAHRLARRRSTLFKTLRANYAHVVPGASEAELDAMAERALDYAGRSYVDMFRATTADYETGRIPVRVMAEEWAAARATMSDGRGTIIAGAHMGNFDLASQWIAAQGFDLVLLGLAEPDAGTRLLHRLRRQRGTPVVSAGVGTLREMMARLKRGGIVATGIDRPIDPADQPLPFFGAPARLPTGYVRLAIQTQARVLVAVCMQAPDGVYVIRMAPPIEPEVTGDRAADIRHTTERILAALETLIRLAPDQWLMFVPVWLTSSS